MKNILRIPKFKDPSWHHLNPIYLRLSTFTPRWAAGPEVNTAPKWACPFFLHHTKWSLRVYVCIQRSNWIDSKNYAASSRALATVRDAWESSQQLFRLSSLCWKFQIALKFSHEKKRSKVPTSPNRQNREEASKFGEPWRMDKFTMQINLPRCEIAVLVSECVTVCKCLCVRGWDGDQAPVVHPPRYLEIWGRNGHHRRRRWCRWSCALKRMSADCKIGNWNNLKEKCGEILRIWESNY